MTCHVDKCKAAHLGGDNSEKTFKIINSELPVATKERDLEVTADYAFKISGLVK